MVERKVLIIPYLRDSPRKTKVAIVRHAASGDWTFFSGTCEPNENPHACVMREIEEETLGRVKLWRMPKATRRIRLWIDNKRIDAYFIRITSYNSVIYRGLCDFQELCKTNELPPESENIGLEFVTCKQFMRKRVWEFIRDRVMQAESFIHCLHELGIAT